MEKVIYCEHCGTKRPAEHDIPSSHIKKGDILHFNKGETVLIADTRIGKIYQCLSCRMIKIL